MAVEAVKHGRFSLKNLWNCSSGIWIELKSFRNKRYIPRFQTLPRKTAGLTSRSKARNHEIRRIEASNDFLNSSAWFKFKNWVEPRVTAGPTSRLKTKNHEIRRIEGSNDILYFFLWLKIQNMSETQGNCWYNLSENLQLSLDFIIY